MRKLVFIVAGALLLLACSSRSDDEKTQRSSSKLLGDLEEFCVEADPYFCPAECESCGGDPWGDPWGGGGGGGGDDGSRCSTCTSAAKRCFAQCVADNQSCVCHGECLRTFESCVGMPLPPTCPYPSDGNCE